MSFDRIDESRLRSGSGVKWGSLPTGTIGAWVADMDFGLPPAVKARLWHEVEREDFGYPHWPTGDPVVAAFEQRMHTRYGWTPSAGHTRVFSDLIQVLQVVIEHTTAPGDGVALHVPTYPPFLASIRRAGRRVVPIPLRHTGDGWRFDAEVLRGTGCRLLVLVNPQNPTGRVFTRAELIGIAALAEELDLVVLSDEIHADLTHPGHRHLPFASLSAETARRTVTATSATKAFNIAALRCAVAHIGVPALRRALDAAPLDYFGTPNTLGRAATVAAWQDGDPWLAELLETLRRNRDTVTAWLGPDRRYHPPEATYLAWFEGTAAPGVKLSEGAEFSAGTGVDTSAFVRLNFATSPDTLAEVLRRLASS
ncbi:aminotransferase class I/II-fold pyridoxal phosphate-dependent enzyme [Lentzea sp. NPDC042327]|uniref:MalY/PatB family protein n=1 Tax=Lentzea sp. NPDC042327 TaxID=3154801 RepID=UPI0033D2DFA1